PAIVYERHGERIEVPAERETVAALEQAQKYALLIKPNEEELDLEQALLPKRLGPQKGLPAALRTTPKPHQREGIDWLQKAWLQGLPGVLLADDMGLGKTLQGLAFLAWLREGMRLGAIERAPVLIVAPTGLLENWR
ncbi:MAG: SNF2-related protein, partial [Geminicoccaceae bacterium]|nr:SNF2-related protein [Geminicoccaceae bacterium]